MNEKTVSSSFTEKVNQHLEEELGGFDDFAQDFSGQARSSSSAGFAPGAAPYREMPAKIAENPLKFTNVAMDPALGPQGAKDLGVFSRLALRMERGQLTRQQVSKTIQLIFNTEFQHLALQASLQLSEANEKAVHEYLRRTTAMRRQMSVQIGKELISVMDVYWKAVERAARARSNWQSTIKKLEAGGLYSKSEAESRIAQTTAAMLKVEADCKLLCDQIVNNIMDKVQHALSVRVNDLIGDENATVSKLIPH